MQLSDEQIVNILIDKYKRSGSNLSKVLQDPVFKALPLSARMAAIRDHAAELSSGINPSFNGSNYKNIGVEAGFGALAGGAAARSFINKSDLAKTLTTYGGPQHKAYAGSGKRQSIIFGLLAGGAVGALGGLMSERSDQDRLQHTKNTLSNLGRRPSDRNAVLAYSDIESAAGNPLVDRVKSTLLSIIPGSTNEGVHALSTNMFKPESDRIDAALEAHKGSMLADAIAARIKQS